MTHPSWLEINLSGLDANLAALRQIVGASVKVCCVLKANAYGLGAVRIAKHLVGQKADMLAVYNYEEVLELAETGIDRPILMLMPLREWPGNSDLDRLIVSGRLHLTIHDLQQLAQVDRIGRRLGCPIPVHLYLDTGMSRSGMNAVQMSTALDQVESMGHARLVGIYTHLATADCDVDFARRQVDQFDRFMVRHQARIPPAVVNHVANTFATLRGRRYHQAMVRVGLGLFGYGMNQLQGPPVIAEGSVLRPIVRWLSSIVHIQHYPSGSPVGYGCTHHLSRDSVLGIVPVGYGHGYPLALGNRASVRLVSGDGQCKVTAPVVGRVSMDQIVIDLTRHPAGPSMTQEHAVPWPDGFEPRIGSRVELISDDPKSPCSLPSVAQQAGSSCHELLCRLSPRLPRRWWVEPVVPIYSTENSLSD